VISWAECCLPEGEAWYAWLFPQLARRVNVLPCFVDTPPFWGVAPKTSAPPGNLKSYADFLDVMITRFGSVVTRHPFWTHRTSCFARKSAWRKSRQVDAICLGAGLY